MVALHQRALSSISGPQLAKWGQEVSVLLEQVIVNSCNTVVNFLENAGQRELLRTYQQTEQELTLVLVDLVIKLKELLIN